MKKILALVCFLLFIVLCFIVPQTYSQDASGGRPYSKPNPTPNPRSTKPTKKDPKVLAYEKIGERCLVMWVTDKNQMNNCIQKKCEKAYHKEEQQDECMGVASTHIEALIWEQRISNSFNHAKTIQILC
jgi:uncharacterized protein YxeA